MGQKHSRGPQSFLPTVCSVSKWLQVALELRHHTGAFDANDCSISFSVCFLGQDTKGQVVVALGLSVI